MKKQILIIAALLFVTALITSIYLLNRQKIDEGSILVKTDSSETLIRMEDLPLSHVSGEISNKKGETKKIDDTGCSLSDIPGAAGITDYSSVSVYSDDEYHADFSDAELSDHEKAWLIKEEDMLRLIVFGDEDSKRNVKNVKRIEIR